MTDELSQKLAAIVAAGTNAAAEALKQKTRADAAESAYNELIVELAKVYAKLVPAVAPAENELSPPIVITKP